MFDAFELSNLSLALKKTDANLPVAHRLISRQVEVFSARQKTGEVYHEEACKAVTLGNFRSITISAAQGKEKEINRGPFYRFLFDSMLARMMIESATDLCAAVSVMDKNTWPTEIVPQYGEDQVRLICTKFLVPFSDVKNSFRDYKESAESTMTGSLKTLQNRINTLPISTAACEQGFSKVLSGQDSPFSTCRRCRLFQFVDHLSNCGSL